MKLVRYENGHHMWAQIDQSQEPANGVMNKARGEKETEKERGEKDRPTDRD
jgi:hypothetical protein